MIDCLTFVGLLLISFERDRACFRIFTAGDIWKVPPLSSVSFMTCVCVCSDVCFKAYVLHQAGKSLNIHGLFWVSGGNGVRRRTDQRPIKPASWWSAAAFLFLFFSFYYSSFSCLWNHAKSVSSELNCGGFWGHWMSFLYGTPLLIDRIVYLLKQD